MFQHCQPMRNHHTEQLQGGNGKINSEKVSGQSSSIQLVSPYLISPWKIVLHQWFGTRQQEENRLWKWIIKTVQTQWQHKVLGGAGEQSVSRYSYIMMRK